MTIDLRLSSLRHCWHTLTILIAGLVFVLASAAISEASPFELKLSGSSGGGSGGSGGYGGSGGVGGGGGGFGSAGSWGGMKPLTIGKDTALESVRGAAMASTPLDQVISDSIASLPPSPASPAAGGLGGNISVLEISGNASTAPVATLDMGDGNQLPVSPGVAQSLQDAIRQSTTAESATMSVGPTGTTGEGTVGNASPVVGSMLPFLLENIVTYPGQNGDSLSATGSEIAEASMPEPGSLLLLATGLAAAGMRMRRKK
jgi:hypothetical protein